MKTFGIIYRITNLVSGKCYIGQTTQDGWKRWYAHRYEARKAKPRWPIHKAIAKHGSDSFIFEIVDRCSDRRTLDGRECFWIAREGSLSPRGYNATAGGKGISGFKMPEDACRRLGDRMRGRVVSKETGQRISASKRGKRMSDETRQRMARSRLGKRHAPEVCEKIGASHRGRKLTPDHVEKIRRCSASRRHSEAAKAKLRRPVRAGGIDFNSVSSAALAMGVSITTVMRRIASGLDGYADIVPPRKRNRVKPQKLASNG